jgi:Histidine kinase-, DNA gyrase B-, and HSP90-like ATPase
MLSAIHPVTAQYSRRPTVNDEWGPSSEDVLIGKDVLELLSISMYVDPMTIYREYIQNAADAIDEAREHRLLEPGSPGTVAIDLDPAGRSVRIRDNGTGIRWGAFVRRLTALGASPKRGTAARGFRGVGRLAGLGYCQELVFRSRTSGEKRVSELRWDCRRLRTSLRSPDFNGGLTDLIRDVVSVRRVSPEGYPDRFFEAELRGLVRHRNDRLLSPPAVAEYLAQVAPVPFSPAFSFGSDITAALHPHVELGHLDIRVSGIEEPLHRPHRDRFEVGEGAYDDFADVEICEFPGVDGGVAAVAWILHHGYTGAIPAKASIKGLRLRTGNVQVGDATLLDELFTEPRFNAWAVGEVHVIDRRIVPNGRRDHFQPNVHFNNLLNHLGPTIRDIARRCRTSSVRRKWFREFELETGSVREKIGILNQGSLAASDREQLAHGAQRSLATMEKIARLDGFSFDDDGALSAVIDGLGAELEAALGDSAPPSPLSAMPPAKRKMYEHLFSLIYECSANRVAAKALIDRILLKITSQ